MAITVKDEKELIESIAELERTENMTDEEMKPKPKKHTAQEQKN